MLLHCDYVVAASGARPSRHPSPGSSGAAAEGPMRMGHARAFALLVTAQPGAIPV